MYTHIEILAVLVINKSEVRFEARDDLICKLILKLMYFKKEIQIALSFSFVVLHSTFLLYFMQFDQSENFFTDGVQVNLHVRSSNLAILCNILEKDGQIKSKRL